MDHHRGGVGPTREQARLGLPARWLRCPSAGEVIDKRFLPFKTPLCSMYDDQMESRYRFHPSDVFTLTLPPGSKLTLWIDLTKTNRYYSQSEVELEGCEYEKMPMEGHGERPSPQQTNHFIQRVQEHISKNPRGIIGVHCTHGFNRTGFLIAAYLTEKRNWAIDASIGEYARARPVGIYKQDYIDELFERYGDIEDRIIAPNRPSWCHEMDDEEEPSCSVSNGSVNVHQSETETSSNSTNSTKEYPKFMDGLVPSVRYVTDSALRKSLQKKIAEMCGWRKNGFPGSQPVSMERSPTRDNLSLLVENVYRVSWKADGLRYMVLIGDENAIYAFDRDNNVFQLNGISFPHRKESRHIRNTLVDAEMIIDRDVKMENGEVRDIARLLIYDIIKFEKMDVSRLDYDKRLHCIEYELIESRRMAMKRGVLNRDTEPMSIRRKDFWPVATVPKLFSDKFTGRVGHEIDGLIFQPLLDPYQPGRCDRVLKWKPPSHNSVDFKLHIVKMKRQGMLDEYEAQLWVLHSPQPFATMKPTKQLRQYDNKIIECTFKDGEWKFMRERTDKSFPNALSTADAVCNSIRYPISTETLVDFVQYAMKEPMKAMKRPHDAPDQGDEEMEPKRSANALSTADAVCNSIRYPISTETLVDFVQYAMKEPIKATKRPHDAPDQGDEMEPKRSSK